MLRLSRELNLATLLLLAALALLRSQSLAVTEGQWPRLVMAAILNVTGWMVLMGLALLWLPASEAALNAYTMPVWASMIAWPILGERPNLLRVVIGEKTQAAPQLDGLEWQTLTVVECNLDDMNPEFFGHVFDRLWAAGALDVWLQPLQMKKNRPGTLLTIIAPCDLRPALADIIFRETTTIGIRYHEVERECLHRDTVTVDGQPEELAAKLVPGHQLLRGRHQPDQPASIGSVFLELPAQHPRLGVRRR